MIAHTIFVILRAGRVTTHTTRRHVEMARLFVVPVSAPSLGRVARISHVPKMGSQTSAAPFRVGVDLAQCTAVPGANPAPVLAQYAVMEFAALLKLARLVCRTAVLSHHLHVVQQTIVLQMDSRVIAVAKVGGVDGPSYIAGLDVKTGRAAQIRTTVRGLRAHLQTI
jgi:hypothetical protein